MINPKIIIDKKAKIIINKLKENGYEGYVVGGCVRDSILNKIPKDWDITTNALPEEIINIFEKTIPTGLKHGTISVIIENEAFEVTTFRMDGEYLDSRRPSNVKFVNNIMEDLSRRDFTINAMAYNDEVGLIDYFNGLEDLKNKVLKAVGDPIKRFSEDALRMMRAVRFAAQLDFNIEENTKRAINKLSNNINKVSIERVREEFNKLIVANSNYINLLYSLGLIREFMPELCTCYNVEQNNPYHIYNLFEHIIKSTNYIECKLHLKLAMLMHDIGKVKSKTTDENNIDHFYGHPKISAEISEEILKRMKYDNMTIYKVKTLILYHDRDISKSKSIKKLLNIIGEELFRDLLLVKIADIKAQNPKYNSRINDINLAKEKLEQIIKEGQCFSIKDLDITGKDIINLGGYEGREIGIILNWLLEKVIEDSKLNKKETLLKMIKDKR